MKNLNIISEKEKKILLRQCTPVIRYFLEKINNTKFKGGKSHYKDAINSLINFEKNIFDYKDVFFYLLALSPYFLEIENKVKRKEIDFSMIKDPYFWENNQITIEVAIFFTSTFINELYKEEIKLDFKKLNDLNSVEDYYNFRKEIIDKSEKEKNM